MCWRFGYKAVDEIRDDVKDIKKRLLISLESKGIEIDCLRKIRFWLNVLCVFVGLNIIEIIVLCILSAYWSCICNIMVLIVAIVSITFTICLTICIVYTSQMVLHIKESDNAEKAFERLNEAYENIK